MATPSRRSRRAFLRFTAVSVIGTALVPLAAACQSTPPPMPTSAPAAAKPAAAPASATAAKPATTSAPQAAGAPKRGGAVTFALSVRLNTLDPARVDSLPLASIIKHVFRNLTHFDKDGNPIPDLAERWEISPDGLAWTFTLKQGVKFHDGTPFNAQAVKTNIDRILDTANKLPRRSQIAMVKTVDALSDTSVRLNLHYPFAPLLSHLAYYTTQLVSPASLEKWGNDDVGLHPIGTGPYKVDSFMPNEQIVLVRNPDYVGDGPFLDKITVISNAEDSARVAALESGQADLVMSVPPQSVELIKSNPRFRLLQEPSARMLYIGMNMFRDEFKDKRVRQALNYAVDKEAIVKTVMQGFAKIAEAPFANNLWGFSKQTPYTYDPAKAKALLAEAGWTAGSDGILQKDGLKFSVPFLTSQGRYLNDAATAEAVQGYLKAVGIDAQLRKLDQQTIFDMMRKPSAQTPQAESALTLFALGPGPGTAFFADVFNSYEGKFENTNSLTSFYRNPKVDQLLGEAASATDEQKRLSLYKEIQQIVWDEAPWIFLHYLDQTGGARANLQDVIVTPNEFWLLDKSWLA